MFLCPHLSLPSGVLASWLSSFFQSLTPRRLWCLKEVYPPETLVWVRYFPEPLFLEENSDKVRELVEFIRKFSTEADGLTIRMINKGGKGRKGGGKSKGPGKVVGI